MSVAQWRPVSSISFEIKFFASALALAACGGAPVRPSSVTYDPVLAGEHAVTIVDRIPPCDSNDYACQHHAGQYAECIENFYNCEGRGRREVYPAHGTSSGR